MADMFSHPYFEAFCIQKPVIVCSVDFFKQGFCKDDALVKCLTKKFLFLFDHF